MIRWKPVVVQCEDGVELLLSMVDTQIGSDELSAKGVRFTLSPTAQTYRGIDAVADDGCGNYVNFSQEA